MELNIDRIQVTVDNVDADEQEIAGEVEKYIRAACAQLLPEDLPMGFTGNEVFNLTLPGMDWDDETDKAGKIAQMIRERLFAGEESL
jgi:hypothetical protein